MQLVEKQKIVSAGLMVALLLLGGCQTVQTTQGGVVGVSREQSMSVSAQEVNAAAAKSYSKMLKEAAEKKTLNTDVAMARRVQTIGRKLIAQTRVFRQDALGWSWEINVIRSDEVNAFCMAGGKIGVYAGIIDRLKMTDAELAAVMGHEISHALREHSREQISRQQASQIPGILLTIVTGSSAVGRLGNAVTDVAINLPNSREAEKEADEMGAELAARAGYDPHAAVTLWEKMNRLGGSRPPEFLSTHPSPESRIQDLEQISRRVAHLYQPAVGR